MSVACSSLEKMSKGAKGELPAAHHRPMIGGPTPAAQHRPSFIYPRVPLPSQLGSLQVLLHGIRANLPNRHAGHADRSHCRRVPLQSIATSKEPEPKLSNSQVPPLRGTSQKRSVQSGNEYELLSCCQNMFKHAWTFETSRHSEFIQMNIQDISPQHHKAAAW